ncbi:D-alanyl-D-alanine carboxypeptidase family protein [Terribacillus sp. DMT04]|uniref:D-alanyl-D-alanine carboxypeptidase family protein n=1 Tax=Terribacillus sp. DMT04 TaxID=2850441 RepID=UPI001C2C6141|nr:D-alanyl-D-alanine carboxypeptidase family protein [Terribacillus sp. DMT04]QXE00312.1 D-alanyl-D-alanine carboxypeptidase [Terribacillus sp. DMT04]
MFKRMLVILIALSLCAGLLPGQAAAKPGVAADSAILMELSTGRVLYEKNAADPKRIASITKIMTAIIAIESGKMDETVTVSKNAIYTEGSSIYLKEGEEIPLADLVYGLMLRSGNDAAVAIAEHVGGSEEGFTHLMNEKAAWLGMQDSHFDNPHGLDTESHHSSAYDMALLTRYAMKNDTFRKVSSTKTYKADSKRYAWGNKNKMLTRYYEHSTGGKTGYTKKAGRTLVSTAEKDGMELVVVTINDPDDWRDHKNLFEWGFDEFRLTKLKQPETGTSIIYPLTDKEKKAAHSVTYMLKQQEHQQQIGTDVYYLDKTRIGSVPIYTTPEEPTLAGTVKQVFDEVAGVRLW